MSHPSEPRYFPLRPDVLDLGDRQKRLHSDYIYEWEEDGAALRLVAPEGFVYNGASVPQAVWSIFPPHALDKAAVFHDLIYRRGGDMLPGEFIFRYPIMDEWEDMPTSWTRSQADSLFLTHLTKDFDGPGPFRRRLAFWTVRAFGSSRWNDS